MAVSFKMLRELRDLGVKEAAFASDGGVTHIEFFDPTPRAPERAAESGEVVTTGADPEQEIPAQFIEACNAFKPRKAAK